jgi:hypothetical protein
MLALVATVQLASAYVAAGPFVMPAIVIAADWPAVTAHVFVSVTVSVGPAVLPLVFVVVLVGLVQTPVYPAPVSVTVGLAGKEKPAGMLIVIVSPVFSAVVAVRPTFHVERAKPICGVPANVTALGAVAAVTVIVAAGLTGFVSELVAIVQLAAV